MQNIAAGNGTGSGVLASTIEHVETTTLETLPANAGRLPYYYYPPGSTRFLKTNHMLAPVADDLCS